MLNGYNTTGRWSGMRLPALLALAFGASFAQADTILYGSQGGADSHLFKIDVDTQTVNDIGAIGFSNVGGLRFNNSGTLYAVAGGSVGPPTLMTVSTANGAGSAIGVVNGVQGVDALAFAADGTLYGGGWNGAGALVTIDPLTAGLLSMTPLIGSGNSFCPGLAVDGSGKLYGSRGNSSGHNEDLEAIDPVTGIMSPIGTATDTISDIWFSPGGTLYGCSTTGQLYSIDATTGIKTSLFNTGINKLSGLAGVVPEPCSMTALALGGLAMLRRRKKA